MKTRTKKRQKKAKGVPCGKSYISPEKECRIGEKGQTKRKVSSSMDKSSRTLKLPDSLKGPNYTPAQSEVLERIENDIRDLPFERVVSVNNKGEVIFTADGDSTSVFIPNEAIYKMGGSVITHNHPNLGWGKDDPRSKGFSFSSADMLVGAVAEAREIRAVTTGYDHSLMPPDSGWNEDFFDKKIAPSYTKHYRNLSWSYSWKVIFKEISQAQAEVDFFHELNSRVASDTGMKYKRWER